MSRSGPTARSEGIDSIGHRNGPNVGLQSFAVDDVYRLAEKRGDVGLEGYVVEHRHTDIRIDLNHDVDVAVGSIAAARDRTEQGSMHHPAIAQGHFGTPQGLERFNAIHKLYIAGLRRYRESLARRSGVTKRLTA